MPSTNTTTAASTSTAGATAVTLSSLSSQITQTHQLLAALFSIIMILLVAGLAVGVRMGVLRWLRAKATSRSGDVERAIPLTPIVRSRDTESTTVLVAEPAPPARLPEQLPMSHYFPPTPREDPARIPTPPPMVQAPAIRPPRTLTAPLPLSQRPVLSSSRPMVSEKRARRLSRQINS